MGNESILAFGADGKTRFAFNRGHSIKLSKDFGNLQDLSSFESYEKAITRIINREKPKVLACDLHPEYNSSKLAKNPKFKIYSLKPIQHHHAHIASCMADNNIEDKVIGVAFDGTGFGIDGNIWGGEFLIVDKKGFNRAAYLNYIPMPGGEMAVKEPWRMALAYLYESFGDKYPDIMDKKLGKKAAILKTMIKKGLNSPKTSSIGRLFDAAGTLINRTNFVKFEGEAAIKLEKLAEKSKDTNSYYKISIKNMGGEILVGAKGLIRGLIRDLKGIDKGIIAMKFHNSIARMIYDVTKELSRIYNVEKIVLSGGVFQNKILLDKTQKLFKNSNLTLYTHKNIPTSDAGIAVGQAFIAQRST